MQKDRAEWLKNRQLGLGGSDIAAIMGKSKWKTPYGVFIDKTTPISDKQEAFNPIFARGHMMEPFIAALYERETGNALNDGEVCFEDAFEPWMRGSVDRLLTNNENRAINSDGTLTMNRGCELKSMSFFAAKYDEITGALILPETYEMQCRWYMNLTDVDTWDCAVLVADESFFEMCKNVRSVDNFLTLYDIVGNWTAQLYVFTVTRDADIESEMISKGRTFWENNVLAKVAPPHETVEDILVEHNNPSGTILATEEIAIAISELKRLRSNIKGIEQQIEPIEFQIKSYMKDCNDLLDVDGIAVTWRKTKPSSKIDYKSIVDELGVDEDLVKKHTVKSEGYRRFLLK